MIHSIRTRLLLTLIGVVAVAIGTVALLASSVSSRELQRYVALDTSRNQRVVNTVIRSYAAGETASEPAALAEALSSTLNERVILADGGSVKADSAGLLAGQVLNCNSAMPAVIVSTGAPVCDAPPPPVGLLSVTEPVSATHQGDVLFFAAQAASIPAPGGLDGEPGAGAMLAIAADGQGAPAIIIQRLQGGVADPIEVGFLSAVNRSLLWAVLVAGLAALALTLLMGRYLLGPIEALTAAARQLERGELRQRVAVSSRDEIGELARSFNAMADGLVRQEQLRRNMTSDIAHELRTPLTNIIGYIEAMRDGVAQPSPGIFASLQEEAQLLGQLVDDLQDLALAEAGQLRINPRATDVAGVVAAAIEAAGPAAADKGLRLHAEFPDELPLALADPARIGQVLRNLLNNAITHTPPDGAVTVAAELRGDELHISVCDTGPGIPPEHLPNIFERFYRADPARGRASGGAGLGLAIVRQLVAAHGGRVWAEGATGAGGARFTFTLPLADLNAPLTAI